MGRTFRRESKSKDRKKKYRQFREGRVAKIKKAYQPPNNHKDNND